jgi:hypothetical protein
MLENGKVSTGSVARRAYELYSERGGTHGCDVEDWLTAEKELTPLTVSAKSDKGQNKA